MKDLAQNGHPTGLGEITVLVDERWRSVEWVFAREAWLKLAFVW